MSAIAHAPSRGVADRRRYQQEVERLLEQIGRRTGELRSMMAAGATAQGLAELKHDLRGARERLAALTTSRS
ncbi:MAG TPA: hypothetical protein VFA66_01390 [Gaiellaceae bacterium]|nr:hypothetical protein [Gaiellaceae bacterium]